MPKLVLIRPAVAATFLAIAASASAGQHDSRAVLSAHDVATFCGSRDHETSGKYAAAVLAEIKRREAAGAKSAAEALRSMRADLCSSQVGVK